MTQSVRLLRWAGFLPLSILASALVIQVGYLASRVFGGGSVFGWLIIGGLAAHAFFSVAFRVAPSVTPAIKWLSVAVLLVLAILAAYGAVISAEETNPALAYLMIVAVAIYYARHRPEEFSDGPADDHA